MSKQRLECVPNFSEGVDPLIIKGLKQAVEQVPGVQLLNIDSGEAAHRTVFTFAGEPDAVIEAAYQAIKRAAETIDMSRHEGEHPRMGATDVCPLIPLQEMDLKEADAYAKKLAKRVGEELNIPVFLYEYSAYKHARQNLANVRKGGYEGMRTKLDHPEWQPDFGPVKFLEKVGVTAIGARDFLIAYNINLNTKKTEKAHEVACDVRESGRPKRNEQGDVMKDAAGNIKNLPGALKKVKGLGWYIQEFGQAQLSMNLTDINTSPLHQVFETVVKKADQQGLRVTGSEIVGMVPKRVLLDAGRHFLQKQQEAPADYTEAAIIDMAVLSLELNDVVHFDPQKKVIEYQLLI